MSNHRLDPTDLKILEILQREGRISNAELSRRIGMSPPPTLERVKKLERNGYIQGYKAIASPKGLGLNCVTYVEVTLTRHGQEGVERFMRDITRIEEVMECHHITGGADFLLKVVNTDIPAYEDFILHRLTALPDVQHLKTLVVLSTLKQETRLPTAQLAGDRP